MIRGETPEDYDAFRDGLMADFDPQGTIECELVDRLAGLLWRLRRVPTVEKQLINNLFKINRSPIDYSRLSKDEFDQLARILEKAGNFKFKPPGPLQNAGPADKTRSEPEWNEPKTPEMLNIVSRYETGLMNAVTRTLSLLHGLQSARLAKDEAKRTIQGQ